MNNKATKHELIELWDAAQHMLKNPVLECFSTAEIERFAERHWRCGERSLDLLVNVRAAWLRVAMRSLAFNGSRATAVQQSAENLASVQFLRLQQAAWMQWRNVVASGLNPFYPASVAATEDTWRDCATSWQQGVQNVLRTQQNLVSTLARAREQSDNSSRSNRDTPPMETPSGQRTAA